MPAHTPASARSSVFVVNVGSGIRSSYGARHLQLAHADVRLQHEHALAPLDNVAASPIPSTSPLSTASESLYGKDAALGSTAIETTLIPPAGIARAKMVRIVQYHRRGTGRHWATLWRPDARAGPHPGGGFYGPPNVNVGYINPR